MLNVICSGSIPSFASVLKFDGIVWLTVKYSRASLGIASLFTEAEENDIVVTRDIPFAARLVEKGICVMNDRGFVFTKYNIQDKLMERAFNMNLSEIGFASRNKKTYYGDKEFAKFSACFDTEVEKRLAFRATN